MRNRITSFRRLKGKKRYIALGLIAFELMSLPAAAKIIQTATTHTPTPRVLAVEIVTDEAGVSRFIVNSNDGFGIEVEGLIGDVNTTVHESGVLASNARFGDDAQLPGDAKACSHSASTDSQPIYQAIQKTELTHGHVVDRSVVFEFHYDAQAKPSFEFTAGMDSVDVPRACEA